MKIRFFGFVRVRQSLELRKVDGDAFDLFMIKGGLLILFTHKSLLSVEALLFTSNRSISGDVLRLRRRLKSVPVLSVEIFS